MPWSFSLWRPEFPEGHDECAGEALHQQIERDGSKGLSDELGCDLKGDSSDWEGKIHSWRASQFSRCRRSAVTDHQRKGDDWVSEDELCEEYSQSLLPWRNRCWSGWVLRRGPTTHPFKSNGPLLFAKMSAGRRHFRCTRGGGHEQR
jgi:hypothetical protein